MLWSGAFVGWIGVWTRWEIDLFTLADCKVGFFIFYFSSHYSSALLVIMSIEKFIALYFPFKSTTLCTTKVAKLTSGITALILALYNLQYIVVYKVYKYNNGVEYCAIPNLTHLAVLDRIDSVLLLI